MFSLNSDLTVFESCNIQNNNANIVTLIYKLKPNVRMSKQFKGKKSYKLSNSKPSTLPLVSSCRTWAWTQPTLGSATSPWSQTSSSASGRRWGSRTRWWSSTCPTPPTQSGGPSLPTVPSWILPAKSSLWKVREERDAVGRTPGLAARQCRAGFALIVTLLTWKALVCISVWEGVRRKRLGRSFKKHPKNIG